MTTNSTEADLPNIAVTGPAEEGTPLSILDMLTAHASHMIDDPDRWCQPDIRGRSWAMTWDETALLHTKNAPSGAVDPLDPITPDVWLRVCRAADAAVFWIKSDYLAHQSCTSSSCEAVRQARAAETADLAEDPDAMVFAVAVSQDPDTDVIVHAADIDDVVPNFTGEEWGR